MSATPPVTPAASPADALPAEVPEQGFGAVMGPRGDLPLTALEVDATVVGEVAEVCLTQRFHNPTEDALEVAYVFPVPRSAAIVRARVRVGARTIVGEVKERGEAREAYQQAKDEGRAAALLEQERGDVFTLSLGNIGPREEAEVELTLAQSLHVTDDEVTLRFPFTMVPRYVPGAPLAGAPVGDGVAIDTDRAPDASRVTPPVLLPGTPAPVALKAQVRVRDAARRLRVSSSIAASTMTFDAGWWTIALRLDVAPDRDWVVRAGGEVQASLQVALDPGGDEGTFELTLPPTASEDSEPVDVVVLLDRSGSMRGWPLGAATDAVVYLTRALRPDDRLAVVAFDHDLLALVSPVLAPATAAHVDAVQGAARRVVAGGGTELGAALRWGTEALGSATGGQGREQVMIVITDGAVADDDALLREVGSAGFRVHTVGVCASVNEGLLGRLSDVSGGLCELVESASRMEEVVARLVRQVRGPSLRDGALTLNGVELDTGALVPPPTAGGHDVFEGRPLRLRGRFRGSAPSSATFRAVAKGGPLQVSIDSDIVDTSALRTLWAREWLEQLEQRYAIEGSDALASQILAHALSHQLPSRLTAWVAVSGHEVVPKTLPRRRQVQPLAMPAGFGAGLLDEPDALRPRLANTRAGTLKGKFSTMSPEAVRGLPLNTASDVFVLGAVLYQLLTGTKLFAGDSEFHTLERVRDATLPEPLLPASLAGTADLLRAMLQRTAAARRSAAELIARVDDLLVHATGDDLLTATAADRAEARRAASAAPPAPTLLPGEVEVVSSLGLSASASLWLAWWREGEAPPKQVVLRRLHDGAPDPEVQLMLAEVARQPHPAIRAVYALARVPDRVGVPSLVRFEEMIWSVGVLELARRGRTLPERAVLEVARQVLELVICLEPGTSRERISAEAMVLDTEGHVRHAIDVGPLTADAPWPLEISDPIAWPDAAPPPPGDVAGLGADPRWFVPIRPRRRPPSTGRR